MVNSVKVDHTMPVLVSHYNNLRDDVLHPTTGHNHSGSTDCGRQLEGSIALVDHSIPQNKMQYGAMFATKRQGASSIDWRTSGTNNYDFSNDLTVQFGIIDVTINAGYTYSAQWIIFGTPFIHNPFFFATVRDPSINSPGTVRPAYAISGGAPAPGSALLVVVRSPDQGTTSSVTVTAQWLAIG